MSPVAICILVVFVAGAGFAFFRMTRNPDFKERFDRHYASASARIIDATVVAIHALCQMRRRRSLKRQTARLLWALGVLIACLAIPVLIVLLSNTDGVSRHGVEFGAGVLAWTCLLELGGSGRRLQSTLHKELDWLSLPRIALVLSVADCLLIAAAILFDWSSGLNVAIAGAALVAIADLISFSFALWWSTDRNHLAETLKQPSVDLQSEGE